MPETLQAVFVRSRLEDVFLNKASAKEFFERPLGRG